MKGDPLGPVDIDMAALNLTPVAKPDVPKAVIKERRKILEEVRMTLSDTSTSQKVVSLVIVGHVDAGKSTLMGRLLYELGRVDERTKNANERQAEKQGKGSFSWAWSLDESVEERERGVTMDIGMQHFVTPHRRITILDAPGHKDFIPNMISGASQADCALLVVDASVGNFEAGFRGGGQTREHVVLVRSLGVSQVIIAVNKLDMVDWSQDRYNEIVVALQAYFVQVGFQSSKTRFVPVGATSGVNLLDTTSQAADGLTKWYSGPSLVDLLDQLEPPARAIESPLRIPITNVFRGQTSIASGTGVTGRISSGIVQTGERLRVLPGNESALVRLMEVDDESVPWAAAGVNATLYLSDIDPIHLSVGFVLCQPDAVVPLMSTFGAQIIIMDITVPLIAGASVELFHQSRNTPAEISKFKAILDRGTGAVLKQNPRILSKGVSANVVITIRVSSMSGPSSSGSPIPLEAFRDNKDLGRILLRRNGETVAAGIVTDLLN